MGDKSTNPISCGDADPANEPPPLDLQLLERMREYFTTTLPTIEQRILKLETVLTAPEASPTPERIRNHPRLDFIASEDFDTVIVAGKDRYTFTGHAQQQIIRALYKSAVCSDIGLLPEQLEREVGHVGANWRVRKCFIATRRGQRRTHPAIGRFLCNRGFRWYLHAPER